MKDLGDVTFKRCPKCGIQNNENVPFCTNCGAKFEEKISDFKQPTETEKIDAFEQQSSDIYKESAYFKAPKPVESMPEYQPYGQPSPYNPEKQSKKKKPVIAIVAIAIAAIVFATAFFVLFTGEKDEEKNELDRLLDSIKNKIGGGPTVSLQSLGSGNFQSIPADGCIAKYYMYYNGEKIGETVEANAGITTYNGINCFKILGRSDITLTIMETTTSFTIDYTCYINENTNIPIYMNVEYTFPESQGGKVSSTISWNQNTGEIKMTIPMPAQEITLNFPTEYWGSLLSVDDLYVGYTKEFDYTMTNEGITTDISMNISVTNQTDVTVLAGQFEDCYVLEFAQTESNYYSYNHPSVFMKVWISEDGVVPKVESTVLSMYITQELEGYYTT